MFDRALYWERRNNWIKRDQLKDPKTGETIVSEFKPLRGQGDPIVPKRIKGYVLNGFANRKARRKAAKEAGFFKPGRLGWAMYREPLAAQTFHKPIKEE